LAFRRVVRGSVGLFLIGGTEAASTDNPLSRADRGRGARAARALFTLPSAV